ncbi:MarR family winged helix-turn-helix transcriptional regulator [Dethiobacter alkaliphilus]|uniref:Transcriptional regulator, MarR family n=1 Tax=Dethiobacter alkaliphilus AHT 1 TaxID=555088 RepID=C0GKJ7_DETAL|nr:MarR family transcriptional regulator [Dethiobacter alkaliphilus]EEG76164.1 transcriptional regulator, MarR family [Dethiobacter alkaliphilus AHT 1]
MTEQQYEAFTKAFQEIFPKLMHYLEAEEMRELTGLGITPGQINALLILYIQDDLTMGALSQEIYLAESAATRLVDRLVKLNLVKRKGDEKDRRVVRVYLTSYGRQLASLVFERRNRRFGNLAERLTETERDNLITSVKAVLRVFEEMEAEAAAKIQAKGEKTVKEKKE